MLEVNNFLGADHFRSQTLRDELNTQGGAVAAITGGSSVVFSVDPDAAFASDIFGRTDYQGQNLSVVGGVSEPLKPSQKFHSDPDALHV